jgi:hypothetical protein
MCRKSILFRISLGSRISAAKKRKKRRGSVSLNFVLRTIPTGGFADQMGRYRLNWIQPSTLNHPSNQRQIRVDVGVERRRFALQMAQQGGEGDHRGVVGAHRGRSDGDFKTVLFPGGFERGA